MLCWQHQVMNMNFSRDAFHVVMHVCRTVLQSCGHPILEEKMKH